MGSAPENGLRQYRLTRPPLSSPASCSSSHPDPRVVAQSEEAQWEVLPDLVYDGLELNDEVVIAKKRRCRSTEAPVASAGR